MVQPKITTCTLGLATVVSGVARIFFLPRQGTQPIFRDDVSWMISILLRQWLYIRPDKLDLLFLISHFLDLGAGGRLLFITSLFNLISDFSAKLVKQR